MPTEQEYRKKFAISQSSLKDWKDKAPIRWYERWILNKKEKKSSEAMDLGNLVDILIFTPDQYEKRFSLAEGGKPSDTICDILIVHLDGLIELNKNIKDLNDKDKSNIPFKTMDIEHNEDLVKKISKDKEYYVTQPDRAFKEILKHEAYFKFLIDTYGKTVITQEMLDLAKELVNILQTDPVSRPFFIPKKGCEVIFQQQLFVDYELSGFDNLDVLPCKGMTDIIHFNHKRKEVREVDLKVTNSAMMFYDAIKRFNYIGQHSFYDFLIRQWLLTYKDGKYADYSVQSPLNVVIDDDIKTPFLYMYNYDDLQIARTGIEGTHIKGWEGTINEIAYHIANNKWERPIEHEKNGYISVKYFNRR